MAVRTRHHADATSRQRWSGHLHSVPVAGALRALRRGIFAIAVASLAALVPTVAWAHGTVTGIEDVWQDYGVAIFLALVVIVGAGVLIWVLLAPLPIETTDDAPTQPRPSNLDEPRRIDHEHGRAP